MHTDLWQALFRYRIPSDPEGWRLQKRCSLGLGKSFRMFSEEINCTNRWKQLWFWWCRVDRLRWDKSIFRPSQMATFFFHPHSGGPKLKLFYWPDITKNVIVFIHACSLILRGTVWNFFFSARLHLFCKRQPSGSLHMLFLDNTCHTSGWSVPYDFSWSSALTRCFISPCKLVSISQHLLNIYRRTSSRQF